MIRNIVLYLCGDENWERVKGNYFLKKKKRKNKNSSLSGKYIYEIGNVGFFSFCSIVIISGKFLSLSLTLKFAEINILEGFIV